MSKYYNSKPLSQVVDKCNDCGYLLVHIESIDRSYQCSIVIKEGTTVLELKNRIHQRIGIEKQKQYLISNGTLLKDSHILNRTKSEKKTSFFKTFASFVCNKKIVDEYEDEVSILLQIDPHLHHGWHDIEEKDPCFFDHKHDLDLRKERYSNKDGGTIGGMKHIRPIGSYVKMLNVRDKYDDDAWLGDEREEGAWAIAYHGSSFENIHEILRSGSLQERFSSKNNRFGPGIYCSPDPLTAECYAKQFLIKGQAHKAYLQVRVDPKRVKICTNTRWVVPEAYIRITGVCIIPIEK